MTGKRCFYMFCSKKHRSTVKLNLYLHPTYIYFLISLCGAGKCKRYDRDTEEGERLPAESSMCEPDSHMIDFLLGKIFQDFNNGNS